MSKEESFRLYNTETKDKQRVRPENGNTLSLYTCGPTVYNFAHIGNFRTYVCEDLLRRTIKFFGIDVRQVMNLTDVDDKTIKGAVEKGVSLAQYTKPFINSFFDDLRALGIEEAEEYPAATDHIDAMIEMIQTLMDKGIAYKGADGSIYFNIREFPSYGRLSHLDLAELKTGASNREGDEYDKDEAADFVLWKAYDKARDGAVFWESPFGKGRPGWHIECSAMAMKILGDTVDIHVGGVDNMFPHHENEIAQSEACSGKSFVRHWMHVEHLLVGGKKMSKSLGNFYTLRDLLAKGYTGQQVRFMLLQGHYRTQLNFTLEGLDGAAASLQRIEDFLTRLKAVKKSEDGGKAQPIINKMISGFKEALGDDLNISVGLACLFDAVRQVNQLADDNCLSANEALAVVNAVQEVDAVIGVLSLKQEEEIPAQLQEALEKREKARKEKNYAVADEYRDFIASHGYKIEDSPEGVRLKKQRVK